MKKNLLSLFICFLAVATQMSATIHLINQQGLTFSPDNLTVLVGDTVRFRWNTGSHNTVSMNVPEGAETWSAPLNSGNQSYDYKVTVEGSYTYECTFHSGQDGVFTALASPINVSSVQSAPSEMNVRTVAGGNLLINMKNVSGNRLTISMLDITGREVAIIYQGTVASEDFTIRQDVASFQRGIYFVRFQEGARVTTRKVLVQ